MIGKRIKECRYKKILVIGSGPIVIGQAGEFDYSGTQACKALKQEGIIVVLLNSNPATVMTDYDTADIIYIEPITFETAVKIIEKEKIDAILAGVGGQTALNLAVMLHECGILEKYDITLLGATYDAIKKSEDREIFAQVVNNIGYETPKHVIVNDLDNIENVLEDIGLPAIVRPSFTLGGTGGGIAYTKQDFVNIVSHGLYVSPNNQVQIDESILGWKEFEFEMLIDKNDNCICICAIENIDPVGVHTGDSITVAPVQTLRDVEFQKMRDASIHILKAVGLRSSGANVQFAYNAQNGEIKIIEINPRVSRSSALASKATGYPIAYISVKLALGYSLDELKILEGIPASIEPSLDYVAVKIPRFNFDRFANNDTLSSSMKSVGEVMAIGLNFLDALQKAFCSLETNIVGLEPTKLLNKHDELRKVMSSFSSERILYITDAIRSGLKIDEICQITKYDKWFVKNFKILHEMEEEIRSVGLIEDRIFLLNMKKHGFSDERIADLTGETSKTVYEMRKRLDILPSYKMIDISAGEIKVSNTGFYYDAYSRDAFSPLNSESNVTEKEKVIILGSGPNRIGQGIEFDYMCVHAIKAIKELGYEAIMINCNPETVSTDSDISDKLYFTAINFEKVIDIINHENKKGGVKGVVLQFGGQTPLKLAKLLHEENVQILGTNYAMIDLCENRDKFSNFLLKLDLIQTESIICFDKEDVWYKAKKLGFPLIMRPSYVIGGQAMEVIYDYDGLELYIKKQEELSFFKMKGSLLIDKFLSHATEVDVDVICDESDIYIAGIMEHIEEAGIHSGDSSCSFPSFSLKQDILSQIKIQSKKIAVALNFKGLINIQFAIKDSVIYVLEVNPRASRTVPFIAKASGMNLVKIAMHVILGKSLSKFDLGDCFKEPKHFAIKIPVFSFNKFADIDVLLGPEMKSTGEVMGIDKNFGVAMIKAYNSGGTTIIPKKGTVFISVKDEDKSQVAKISMIFVSRGFKILATGGTSDFLTSVGIENRKVNKVKDGMPHIVEILKNGEVDFIINTTSGIQAIYDSFSIRSTALLQRIPCCTNISLATVLANSLNDYFESNVEVISINEYTKDINKDLYGDSRIS